MAIDLGKRRNRRGEDSKGGKQRGEIIIIIIIFLLDRGWSLWSLGPFLLTL